MFLFSEPQYYSDNLIQTRRSISGVYVNINNLQYQKLKAGYYSRNYKQSLMKKEAFIKEPMSGNIFERYYRLIENIRLKIGEAPSEHQPEISKELLQLETIIHAFDGVTQDIETSSKKGR